MVTSQIKPDSPTKAPHPAPTSVPNVASYSRIRRVSKSIKHQCTSENKTYQPPLDSGLATLTPDVRPVNQGCSLLPSAAQIMAINTSSNSLWPAKAKVSAISSIAKNVINNTQAKHNSNSIRGWIIMQLTSDRKTKSTGMVGHFAKCGLNNVPPIILERVRSSDPFIRKAREQFYINIFGTEINAQ